MKLYRKEKLPNQHRNVYLFGIKVFSYRHKYHFEKTNKTNFYLKNDGVLDIDLSCRISNGCVLQNDAESVIKIGKRTVLSENTVLHGGNITIGNNVIISPNVVITTENHSVQHISMYVNISHDTVEPEIEIQDDVYIGANATIKSGAHIGWGAVIGANSVVDSDVPPFAIMAGNPATVVGSRLANLKTNKDFKFSIIMPNFNGDKYLEQAIQAFLNQDYKKKELVIVDSASTDNSHNILQKYADGKVIKWIKEKDHGLTDAINIAVKHCTGDYIGYAGSDDLYINNILKIANAVLQTNPSDIFYYDYINYFPKKNWEHRYRVAHEFTRENLIKHMNFLALQDIFFARNLLQEFPYDATYKYAMDYEIYLNILYHKSDLRILHIPVYGTRNINDDNISSVYSKGGYDESNRAALKYAKTDEEKALVEQRIKEDKGY